MKKFGLCWLITLCSFAVFGQSDSLVLAHAPWQIDTIGELVLKQVHFTKHEYFNSNQNICVLEIPVQSATQLKYAYETKRTRTSAMAEKQLALAAINGSFFDMQKHNPICYLRIDGEEVGINTPGTDTVNRKYYQYGTFVLANREEHPEMLARIVQTDSNRFWERVLPDANIMTAGPLLILHGSSLPMRNDLSFVHDRHNRTAVGILADGTILFVTIDGRTREAAGMSLDELISTLRWLGCEDALNMDGGGSTTLYIKGYSAKGIVNYPTDNGLFDHAGERAVSNAILVVPETNN